MSSFQIADCPTSLATTEKGEGEARVRGGKLSLTVRNVSDRTQTARISVESDDGADPAWFTIGGAPSTNPQFLERDFDANATQTIDVTVSVPADAKDGTYSFRVKATSEADPDNDFTESPAVALSVPALKEVPPPKKFPWWIVIVGAVAAVVVVGVVVFLLTRGGPELVEVAGDTPQVAREKLIAAGFEDANITEEIGPATGAEPGTVVDATLAGGGNRVTLIIDPGVTVRAAVNTPLETALGNLLQDGLQPIVARVAAEDVAFFRVQTANPGNGEVVALGTEINITTFVPDPGQGSFVIPSRIQLVCPPFCYEVMEPTELPQFFAAPELPAGNAVILENNRNLERLAPGVLELNR